MNRDLILYIAYCIGFTLIGLLIASGWHDFFAASHTSMGKNRRITFDDTVNRSLFAVNHS